MVGLQRAASREIISSRADRQRCRRHEPPAFWLHVIACALVAVGFLLATVNPRQLMLGFGALVAYFALNGILIATVKPSIHDRAYARSRDPGAYWLHILLQIAVVCALIAAALLWA
jgi:uncharacterized membrane-anchored protein